MIESMIEVIVLFFLTREIGRIAIRKGLKKGQWIFYTIAGWVLMEILGIIVGLMIFSQDNLFSIMMVGIAFAVTSYFIIKAQLEKLPDVRDDDVGSNRKKLKRNLTSPLFDCGNFEIPLKKPQEIFHGTPPPILSGVRKIVSDGKFS